MNESAVTNLPKSVRNKIATIFSFLFFFIIIDLCFDFQAQGHWEFALLGCILVCSVLLGHTLLKLYKDEKLIVIGLKKDLAKMQSAISTWQKKTEKMAKDFQNHIEVQLDNWSLSATEKEICMLILKGMSSKDIANLRSTSERTIRNQSSSIYKKSKLKGKSELMTFFLEDLLS